MLKSRILLNQDSEDDGEFIIGCAGAEVRKNTDALIEVDDGVTLENAPRLVKPGAQVLVAGYTIFGSPNPVEVISALKNISA